MNRDTRRQESTAEAERWTVASLYISLGAKLDQVCDILGADASKFQEKNYRDIYTAMLELSAEGVAIDGGAMFGKLKNSEALQEIPTLCQGIETSAHAEHHAKAVLKHWQRRQLESAARWLEVEAKGTGDPLDIIAGIEKLTMETTQGAHGAEVIGAKDGAAAGVVYLEKLASAGGKITGVGCGIEGVDKLTHGFQENNLIILAARPSVGKTAFALNVAHYAAIMQNRPVLFISLEMGVEELWVRMLSIAGGLDVQKVKSGFLAKSEIKKARAIQSGLEGSPLSVIDQADTTIHAIRSAVRTFARKHPDGIVMLDYLQLINSGDAGRKQRYEVVGEQSRMLKGMAKETRLPIMVLAQLGRDSEQEPDGYKMMKHLRESGNIEQDADVIIILHRPNEPKDKDKPNDHGGAVTITIAKHRNGPIGSVLLNFDKIEQRFTDEGGAFMCREYAAAPAVDAEPFDEYTEDENLF